MLFCGPETIEAAKSRARHLQRCDIEKLTAGYGSKFIGPQQFIYIYSIKPSMLRGDNFEPYPHGFLVDNMGLGGCVLIQELCVRG